MKDEEIIKNYLKTLSETEIHQTFKFLEQLRHVFDYSNERFINFQYGGYIPIGLAIHYMTLFTTEEKFHNDAFVMNRKCLVISRHFYRLIYTYKMSLMDFDFVCIPSDEVNFKIDAINNGDSVNYLELLVMNVSFECLLHTSHQIKGIDRRDNKINSILSIAELIYEKTIQNHPQFKECLIYEPIKHLRPKYNPEISENDSPTQKRVKYCRIYMKDNNYEIGINLQNHGYTRELWWECLQNEFSDERIFNANKDDFFKEALRQKLFCFSD